jgi:hypothetical protein
VLNTDQSPRWRYVQLISVFSRVGHRSYDDELLGEWAGGKLFTMKLLGLLVGITIDPRVSRRDR